MNSKDFEDFEDNSNNPNPEPNSQLMGKILQIPCPSCGSQMTYSAEKQKLSCGHCGYQEDFEQAKDKVREIPLREAVRNMRSYTPAQINKEVIECQSCRSQIMIASNEVHVRCSFCGSEKINKAAYSKNLIQPQGILPFKIAQQKARDGFNAWIKTGWFRPNTLKSASMLESLKGIYLPFWTFDAQSYSEWSGEAGKYYYVTVERNGQQVQERRTEWHYRRGSFNFAFDDVLISAVTGVDRHIIEAVYPYNLKEVINYEPSLMVGWDAQIYNVEIDKGYSIAQEKMNDTLRQEASRRLGGDTQRNLRVSTDFSSETFKHIILPIWVCTYTYNGKTYQFAVNGQTGKVEGEKPISWVKVFFFVLFLVIVIGTIVVLTQDAQGGASQQYYY